MSLFSPLINLAKSLPSGHRREYILGGNIGTAQTINRMRDLVSHGKRDFRIRKLAGQIIQECKPKDYLCYTRSVHRFCTQKIKYAFDPNGVELVETPWSIVESGIADCDSIVILCAALLENLGLSCRFVTIKADVSKPDQFSHVFLECNVPKKGWVTLDCTMPEKPFGWSPSKKWKRKTWVASWDGGERRDGDTMIGLGMLNQAPSFDSDTVPGIEDTVGVRVGNKWAWQLQDALKRVTGVQLEDQQFGKQKPLNPGISAPQFFEVHNADEVMQQKHMPIVEVSEKKEVRSGSGKVLKLVGIVIVGYFLIRRLGR